jgi:DNA invertase Pin-like site-specific DNA recombinase
VAPGPAGAIAAAPDRHGRCLQQRDAGFKSLQEAIDTTSSTGNLVFQIFGAIAEFERNLGFA